MDICGRDDLFFSDHDFWAGKVEICRRDDLSFALHLILGGKRS